MLSQLITILQGLIKGKFYGTVEIKFEAGHIVLVRKSESIKLDQDKITRLESERGRSEQKKI